MRKSKKVIALVLAIVTIFSAISISIMAIDIISPPIYPFNIKLGPFDFSSEINFLGGDFNLYATLERPNYTLYNTSGIHLELHIPRTSLIPQFTLNFFLNKLIR